MTELKWCRLTYSFSRYSSPTTQFMSSDVSLAGDDQMKLDSIYATMRSVLRQIDLAGSELGSGKVANDDCNDTTDNFPDKVNERQNPKAATANSAALSASLVPEPCRAFCPCQCHKTTLLRSPSWFNTLFGSVIFSTNTTLSLSRLHCNMPRICKRSGRLSVQLAYFAPFWVMARAFSVFISRAGMGGINADLAFRAPRIISSGSKIYGCISNGAIESVRDMIVKGETSIYDVDVSGCSLLCASRTFSPDGVKLTFSACYRRCTATNM